MVVKDSGVLEFVPGSVPDSNFEGSLGNDKGADAWFPGSISDSEAAVN